MLDGMEWFRSALGEGKGGERPEVALTRQINLEGAGGYKQKVAFTECHSDISEISLNSLRMVRNSQKLLH